MSICVRHFKGRGYMPRKNMYSFCHYKMATGKRVDLILIIGVKWNRIASFKQQTFCQLGYQFRESICFSNIVVVQ